MKRILYILALIVCLQGCKKDTFDYKVYEPKVEDVDLIEFSTGSPTLIADGKAALQFVIEAYRSVEIKNEDGSTEIKKMPVDYKLLPEQEVKVFVNNNLITGTTFSSTDLSKTTLDCYVQIGNTKSTIKSVAVLQPKAVGTKRYVDVVFHVFELSPTDELYDPLIYQEVTSDKLVEGLTYANAIFSNSVGSDPNGGNANIEFRLAKKTPAGVNLAKPGYNKITYDATWKTNTIVPYNVTNFKTKINATPAYQWDKSKYLNIYILPMPINTFLGDFKAAYQIVGSGQESIKGVKNIVASEDEVPTNDFFANYGLAVHRTVLFPDPNNRVELASYFAAYYAIYPTHSLGNTVEDYVIDTRKYLTGDSQKQNISGGLLKVAIDGQKFLANNAMDDLRYASLRNSFTQGQIERMRLVMERSPVRKAWSIQ